MKFSKFFNEYKTVILAVVSAIAIAVIILGSFASSDITKEFRTSSEVYGKPVITHLDGDEYDLDLNEDESVFLSYTVTSLTFVKGYGYSDIKTLEKLNYRPDECDYVLYINGVKIQANKLSRIIRCPVSLNFRNADESITTVDFTIEFRFYTERTDFYIYFDRNTYVGYINQLVNKGFNIRLIEKPISDTFSNAGNVSTTDLPKNTFIYEFVPSRLHVDLNFDDKEEYLENAANAPYYVYESKYSTESAYASISPNVDLSEFKFSGVIYRDYPIELKGLNLNGSYKASFAFGDGSIYSEVYLYTYETLTLVDREQSQNEVTKKIDFRWNGVSPHTYPVYFNSYTKGIIERTIATEYGTYDVVINPSFVTTDGAIWQFGCGIYLKNHLNTTKEYANIAAVIEAIKNQLDFTITINY
ncbi:MAG: hypothetical protein NC037_01050 [Bacteroides sp.]|nr:hypothetical protein [Bacillota bacterium]MCM1393510.1 hypothetical protein [[Eubacterium] siraeum]MCM1455103.1 hypothetical protein [Bacteroides sp.]